MNEVLRFNAMDIVPDRAAVLKLQGIPAGAELRTDVEASLAAALDRFRANAVPTGVLAAIDKAAFAHVFAGEGRNEERTPVGDVFPQASELALFAVTIGTKVGEQIQACFAANDFAGGAMLDAAASAGADKAADVVQRHYVARLAEAGRLDSGDGALRYSPGYCGWHISGQRRLFEYLRPQRAGMTLRDSFLMEPLKSVSGVIIVGPAGIHAFDAAYSFCDRCTDRGCRERIRSLSACRGSS